MSKTKREQMATQEGTIFTDESIDDPYEGFDE